jgi:hypothetical protein
MSELAFTINGEAFDLPATATAWRIRRMRQRGAPEVVYGRDGLPQTISVEAGLEELRQVVGQPAKYRLDAIDDHAKTIAGLPAAYVIVPPRDDDDTPAASENKPMDGSAAEFMAEAMRLNTELAKSVIDRFPQVVEAARFPHMVEAAASLLRAADGAGLPAREPRATDTEDDEPPVPAQTGGDIYTLLGPVVQMFATSLFNGNLKMPNLGAIFDWRKAKPEETAEKAPAVQNVAASTTPPSSAAPEKKSTFVQLPPLDPKMMQHFLTIQAHLDPKEAQLAREAAKEIGPEQLRVWFDELSKLSVPDAVKRIRELVHADAKADGGSK